MYETVFINEKQKRVQRSPPEIDYSLVDDPIFFKQNEMWEELHVWEQRRDGVPEQYCNHEDDDIPF